MAIRRMTGIVTGAAALVMLAGCVSGPDPEVAYLSAVHADQETTLTDLALVQLGTAICTAVADGGGNAAIVDIQTSSRTDAGIFAAIGTEAGNHLCPDLQDEIRDAFAA